MTHSPTLAKPAFFNQPSITAQHAVPSAQVSRQLYRSESKLLVRKLESNITQVFPKQYTNKYFRNSSLYEEKQNQKLLQLNRFYGFMRKTKMAKRFKEKRINSITEPNDENSENHQSSIHLLNELRFKSIRNKNCTNLEKHHWIQARQRTQPSVLIHLQHKNPGLREVSVSNFENCTNLPKQKISTSRALQKYARLIKQEIFHSNKSHIFDRSPIKKERSSHYRSNIEAKQLTLCNKNTKNGDFNHNRQFNRTAKVHLSKYKTKGVSEFSSGSGLSEQSFDINGWETTS